MDGKDIIADYELLLLPVLLLTAEERRWATKIVVAIFHGYTLLSDAQANQFHKQMDGIIWQKKELLMALAGRKASKLLA